MGNISFNSSEVIRLFQEGESCTSIAKRFSATTAAVTQHLKRQGLRERNRQGKPLDDESRLIIAQRYEKGDRSGDLAQEFGIDQCTVREIAKKFGVKSKPVAAPPRIFSKKELDTIVNLYSKDYTLWAIGQEVSAHPSVVRTALKLVGIHKVRRRRNKPERHVDDHGYPRILIHISDPYFDMTFKGGYVLEHRLVMARHLGRSLLPSETVHHIDGNPANNDPSNLQLRQGKHGKHQCFACADCGSRNIRPIAIDEPKAA
jgi:transposase